MSDSIEVDRPGIGGRPCASEDNSCRAEDASKNPVTMQRRDTELCPARNWSPPHSPDFRGPIRICACDPDLSFESGVLVRSVGKWSDGDVC